MSTVKLVTPYNEKLHAALRTYPEVRIVIARPAQGISKVINSIFNPYQGKVVIFGDFVLGDLPVDSHAYLSAEDLARLPINDIVYGVLHNHSSRTYSADGVTFYDVYQVWYECRALPVVRKYVPRLMTRNFGSIDPMNTAPWGGKTISEISIAGDEDYQRILSADLRFPIILRWGEVLVDGNHRLIKCALTGRKYIGAVTIPGDRLRKCKITNPIDEYDMLF